MLFAFLAGGVTGVFLGLMGGGGGIIAVPALVFILGMETKAAIATSLLVIGMASVYAFWEHFKRGSVVMPIAASFGAAGAVGTAAGAKIGQSMPDQLQLYLLAFLMCTLAFLILLPQTFKQPEESTCTDNNLVTAAGAGFLSGILTGVLGVGGGFVIVPILMLVLRLPMFKAVGTSLLIIAINSLIGVLSYIHFLHLDVSTASFGLTTVAFAAVSSRFTRVISQRKLKVSFAVSLIFISVFMLLSQSFS